MRTYVCYSRNDKKYIKSYPKTGKRKKYKGFLYYNMLSSNYDKRPTGRQGPNCPYIHALTPIVSSLGSSPWSRFAIACYSVF